ncbi:MAG TPA: zinc ribbon domain-containing protein, partial [Rugosimonospora sp.]|nr:zinc ribbon domain-containing protein [Rugosimonospora sp.]
MIVCKTCGHNNQDGDQFCGSCGDFLEWTGEQVDAAPPAPHADLTVPQSQPAPVLPQEVAQRPTAVLAPETTRTPQPGDWACAGCGEANPLGRHFCRRCGVARAAAPPAR